MADAKDLWGAGDLVDLAGLGHDFTRDPYPVYAALRAKGPVHRVRIPEGADAWLVVGHEAGRAALADPSLSKEWSQASPDLGVSNIAAGRHMLNSDPPHHTRLRKLVAREFTPARVRALEPRVQNITDGLLDAALARPGGGPIWSKRCRSPAHSRHLRAHRRSVTGSRGVPPLVQHRPDVPGRG